MKLWMGHGSEHSANLVMIGRFNELADAREAKATIDRLTNHVLAEVDSGVINVGEDPEGYSSQTSELLRDLKIYSLGPDELEQFAYDVETTIEDGEVVITTDEIDVSAFLKVLIDRGARLEVYSAHDYPSTGHRRGG